MRAEEVIRKIRDDGVEIRVLKTFVQSERPRAISGVVPTGPGSGGEEGAAEAGPTEPAGCPQRPPQVLYARVLLAAEERAFGAFGAQLIFLKEKKVKLARRLPFLS